jgi:hypothetical protein
LLHISLLSVIDIKMKILKYHIVRTFPNSNRKIIEIKAKSTTLTNTHTWPLTLLSWNRIGDVMVHVLVSSAVDRVFEP